MYYYSSPILLPEAGSGANSEFWGKQLPSSPETLQPELAYSMVLQQAVKQIHAAGAVLYAVPLRSVHPSRQTAEEEPEKMPEMQGQILWQRNAQTARPTASMTKLMSLLLVQEMLRQQDIDLDEPQIIPPGGAAAQRPLDASVAGLRAGESYTWAELLSYTIIASANDSAYALAILYEQKLQQKEFQSRARSNVDVATDTNANTAKQTLDDATAVKRFVQRMNRRAKELSLKSAQFADPDGWSDKDQISPLDMARLSAFYSSRFPKALGWHRQQQLEIAGRIKRNTNMLLPYYPEIEGLKTGFTYAAGFNFIAELQRNLQGRAWRFIAVVMGIEETASHRGEGLRRRAAEAETLLNWGLQNFAPLPCKPDQSRLYKLQDLGRNTVSLFHLESLAQSLNAMQLRIIPDLCSQLLWLPAFGRQNPGLQRKPQYAQQTDKAEVLLQPFPSAYRKPNSSMDFQDAQLQWDIYINELAFASIAKSVQPSKPSAELLPKQQPLAHKAYAELSLLGQKLGRFALEQNELPEPRVATLLLLHLRQLLFPSLWPVLQAFGWVNGRQPFADWHFQASGKL